MNLLHHDIVFSLSFTLSLLIGLKKNSRNFLRQFRTFFKIYLGDLGLKAVAHVFLIFLLTCMFTLDTRLLI